MYHSLLICVVSNEKFIVILILVPAISKIQPIHTSSSFKSFSCLFFCSLNMIGLGVFLLASFCLVFPKLPRCGVGCLSLNFGKFSAVVISILLSHSFFYYGIPITHVNTFEIFPYFVSGFLFILFFFAFHLGSFC